MARNWRNGTGESIHYVDFPTSTTDYTKNDRGLPRGFKTSADGSVKVKVSGRDQPINTYCVAGVYNNYDVEIIYDDGPVLITDIEMYW